MEEGIKKIAEELKKRIKKKYKLQDIRVFGSSARGEQRKDSDIDVFVHLDHSDRHVEEDLYDISYDIELEYDCLIDLIIIDDEGIKGKIGSAPIFENILSEGASV
ncbi:MAG: nucleotidyltransferase domain-containing protein [Desulfobacterales bacterium]|jgi:predicted nucleotidyltransferase|nr:nucleotidyltransferase domain-containing protein [Desulfobacterales bacterium]